jgi:hypothetical protein
MTKVLSPVPRVPANLDEPRNEPDIVIITRPIRLVDFLASIFGAPRLQCNSRGVNQKPCYGAFCTRGDGLAIIKEALFLAAPAIQLHHIVLIIYL